MEKRSERNLSIHLMFIDLALYRNLECVIQLNNIISAPFKVNTVLKQRCCVTPNLFKIFIQKALSTWMKKCHQIRYEIGNTWLYTLLFPYNRSAAIYRKCHGSYYLQMTNIRNPNYCLSENSPIIFKSAMKL